MSIHKRVNKRKSVWIVRYRDPLPRERTFERKADAQRFERYVRHQLDTDQYLDPEMAKVTFEDWARRWWPTVENSERAPSTISGYESSLRIQVLPYLGGRRLRTFRRIDMEEWLGQLRTTGYANSTIHSARTVAGMVFTSALNARIIASNPLTGIRVLTGTSRTRNALSVEQVEALAVTVDPWWRRRMSWCWPTAGCAPARRPPCGGGTSTTSDASPWNVRWPSTEASSSRGTRRRTGPGSSKCHPASSWRSVTTSQPMSRTIPWRSSSRRRRGPRCGSPTGVTRCGSRQRTSSDCRYGRRPTCCDTPPRASWRNEVSLSPLPPPHLVTIRRSSYERMRTSTRKTCALSPTRWTALARRRSASAQLTVRIRSSSMSREENAGKIRRLKVVSGNDHSDQEIWWRRWDLNPRTS